MLIPKELIKIYSLLVNIIPHRVVRVEIRATSSSTHALLVLIFPVQLLATYLILLI